MGGQFAFTPGATPATEPAYDPMQHAKPGPYTTPLKPDEEKQFLGWVQQNKVPFDPKEDKPDYDMRGFWKALQAKDPRATQGVDPYDKKMHFPDTWKTPNHKTFSNESIYALPTAPKWVGNRFLVDSKTGRVLYDDKAANQ